jgi:hypothetical protein
MLGGSLPIVAVFAAKRPTLVGRELIQASGPLRAARLYCWFAPEPNRVGSSSAKPNRSEQSCNSFSPSYSSTKSCTRL